VSWNILPTSPECIDVSLKPSWPQSNCNSDVVLVGCIKAFSFLHEYYPEWSKSLGHLALQRMQYYGSQVELISKLFLFLFCNLYFRDNLP